MKRPSTSALLASHLVSEDGDDEEELRRFALRVAVFDVASVSDREFRECVKTAICSAFNAIRTDI